ncbi:STAS domain-containing protein [Ramlibacter sp.]|uniref:STAS domain-containing protein n=1 Tax=Ramlibacter sp. TaxID=1917967 RepID=UPI003D0CA584
MDEMLKASRAGGVTVVRPTLRRLDAAVAPAFRAAVMAALEESTPGEGAGRKLVLDLEDVDFVDSSGLGAMVSILKALGGGAVAICNAKGAVQSLFKLTRMDKVFALLGSRDEAVARLGG